MTQLATKAFGKIDVEPEQLIQFPEGLFGFAEAQEYALIEDRDESPFKWLQATNDESLAFVVIQPELFLEDYRPVVSQGDLKMLEVESLDDCLIMLIVTIPADNPQGMTANLQGPILISRERKIGRQVISNDDGHAVRVMILEQVDG